VVAFRKKAEVADVRAACIIAYIALKKNTNAIQKNPHPHIISVSN
jgi:hypothetical protein